MNIKSLNQKISHLYKIAGLYSAKDVEVFIKNRDLESQESNIANFVNELYRVYKLHDKLYAVVGMISFENEDDRFLDLTEEITKRIPTLVKLASEVPGLNNRKELAEKVYGAAEKAYMDYMRFFPKETRKISLDELTRSLSMHFQSTLHFLLDEYLSDLKDL